MHTSMGSSARNQEAASKKSTESAPFLRWYENSLQALLLLLGVALILTNRWFTEVDDECAIIDRAAQPILQTIRLYLSGAGEHEHPPLYDLILHGWLQLTGGEQHFLRLPAIIFYIAGAGILANAAKRRDGSASQTYTLLLIVFWPYGFHFGRLATWYSFCFLLVALVTSNYFRYLQTPHFSNWSWLIACSVLLLYSNYFAWALLGCLAVDFAIRHRQMPIKTWVGLVGTALLLLTAYLPVFRAFLGEVRGSARPIGHIATLFFTGIYNLYCVFVSESVAPWFWGLGVPVAIAIVAILLITLAIVSNEEKRFLFYFATLLVIMAFLGIANTKRMLFISPWLILPLAAALTTPASKFKRRVLGGALLFIAGIGWYGMISRKFYAAPHWVEPWETIAQKSANVARASGIIIGNNASFFFYLTYDLAPGGKESTGRFVGLLPDSTRRPNVYDGSQWLEAGRPTAPHTIMVTGPHFQVPSAPMDEAQQWLNGRCVLENAERLVHDPGAELKRRFGPDTEQRPWRIEILTYACK
jgi:dolichyl-phosphate-mannose-protein mannosyltransferase